MLNKAVPPTQWYQIHCICCILYESAFSVSAFYNYYLLSNLYFFLDYINDVLGPDFDVGDKHVSFRSDEDGFSAQCGEDYYCWRSMVTTHWPRLLTFYNVTLEKR